MSLANEESPLACPIAVSREVSRLILTFRNSPLLLDDGLSLDPSFEDDINNDGNSLYAEIIEKNQTYYK